MTVVAAILEPFTLFIRAGILDEFRSEKAEGKFAPSDLGQTACELNILSGAAHLTSLPNGSGQKVEWTR